MNDEKNINPDENWNGLVSYAVKQANNGDYQQALKTAQESLILAFDEFGTQGLYIASSLNRIGSVYWQQGNMDQAELFLIASVAYADKSLGESGCNVMMEHYCRDLAEFCIASSKFERAQEMYLLLLDIYDDVGSKDENWRKVMERLAELKSKINLKV